jgi:hypothetical protein
VLDAYAGVPELRDPHAATLGVALRSRQGSIERFDAGDQAIKVKVCSPSSAVGERQPHPIE